MTAKELAKLLGLSETSVSFALNDKPGVSEKTRALVKKAAQEHGMSIISGRSGKGDGIIHVIQYSSMRLDLNSIESNTFRATLDGIEFTSTEHGYRSIIHTVMGIEALKKEIQVLEHEHASGILILGFILTDIEFEVLSFTSIPVVVIDAHFTSTKLDCIELNNKEAAFLATNYLIHKRACQPGYIGTTVRTYDFDQRKDGFYDALRYHMMTKSKSIVHEISMASIDGIEEEFLDIIDSKEEIAASYFAENDMMAIGAMRAFKKRGYRIPEDISIIGFDDITLSSYVDPPLTSIHIPRHYIGRIAVNRLIERMTTHDHYAINIHINGYLAKRGSVAPLPGKNQQPQP